MRPPHQPHAIIRRVTAARIPLILFVVVLGASAFFFGGSGFNQNASFDQSRAIADHHTLAIDRYLGNTFDISTGPGGHFYPNKPPGVSLLAAIPYAILAPVERAGGGDPDHLPLLTANLWLVTILICGTSLAAIAVMLFHWGTSHGASARRAVIVALIVCLATPLWAYSTMLFLHLPSAAFLLGGWILLFRQHPRPLAAGVLLGLAGLTNYLCIPAAVICVLASIRSSPKIIAGGAPFAILLALYHRAAFGALMTTPVATENPAFRRPDLALGILARPSLEALWGITFSPYRGLFFIAPVLLIALIGLARMRRFDLWAIVALFIGFNICFNGWHGGYAIGPRYLLPAVPLLGLALYEVPRRLDKVLAVAAALSFALNLSATAVDPQPPDSVRNPLFDYAVPLLIHGEVPERHPIPGWLRQLYTGHVAVNRVAADEALPFMKHAPGSPASEWASFNLGETLAPQGSLWSLIPLLLWLAGGLMVLLRVRPAPADTP